MKTYALGSDGVQIVIQSKNRKEDPVDSVYEDAIDGLVGKIAGTRVGLRLMRALAQCTGRTLEIRKFNYSLDWSYDAMCEVATRPNQGFTNRDSVEAGRSIKGDRRQEDPTNKYYYDSTMLGTGAGADVKIAFTPGLWAETVGQCVKPGSKMSGPGSSPDAVLFHEMVHAHRHFTGSRLEYTMEVDGFPSQKYEEFVAILVSNIYLSDNGATQLRSFNHDIIDAMKEPEKYLNRNGNRKMVDDLCTSSKTRPFLEDLARVPCDFNPLRDVIIARGDFVDRRGVAMA